MCREKGNIGHDLLNCSNRFFAADICISHNILHMLVVHTGTFDHNVCVFFLYSEMGWKFFQPDHPLRIAKEMTSPSLQSNVIYAAKIKTCSQWCPFGRLLKEWTSKFAECVTDSGYIFIDWFFESHRQTALHIYLCCFASDSEVQDYVCIWVLYGLSERFQLCSVQSRDLEYIFLKAGRVLTERSI
jgi:hypothetical protein